MIFQNISWIIVILIGFIILIGILYQRKKFNKKTNYLAFVTLFLSWLFLSIALLHPVGPGKKEKQKIKGADILVVLDVSKSMNTIDIKTQNGLTTRLNFTKQAISKFVSKNPNNNYGLVIFAGNALGVMPITFDKSAFLSVLDSVDYRNINQQGSNFNKALQIAFNRFDKNKKTAKVLVFISDGGDPDDAVDTNFLKNLAKNHPDIKSIVVGVGSTEGGKILLGQNDFGEYIFQKYQGKYVITRINLQNLQKIANALNAPLIILKNPQDLQKINNYLTNLVKKEILVEVPGSKKDYSRFWTILSFIFFVVGLGLSIFRKV